MIIINIFVLTDVLMLIIVEPPRRYTGSALGADEVYVLHNVQTASVIRTGTRIDNNAKI